jgi:hypothetical protein
MKTCKPSFANPMHVLQKNEDGIRKHLLVMKMQQKKLETKTQHCQQW